MDKNKSLIAKIRKRLNVNEKQASRLLQGLYDAHNCNEQSFGLYHYEIPLGQYKEELKRANTAIKSLNEALQLMPLSTRHTLDTLYYAANNRDQLLMQIDVGETRDGKGIQSGFEVIAEKMQEALLLTKQDVVTPGKGGGNIAAKKYIAAIEKMSEYFREVCPRNAISKSKTSKFYKYVQLWFSDIAKIYINDIERHIVNTLKYEHIKDSRGR